MVGRTGRRVCDYAIHGTFCNFQPSLGLLLCCRCYFADTGDAATRAAERRGVNEQCDDGHIGMNETKNVQHCWRAV